MLVHQVFFQFSPELKSEYIEGKVLHNLLAMKKLIPQIVSARWYKNISTEDRDHDFKYVAIFEFEDENKLSEYLLHQAHVDFCNDWLFPNLRDHLNSLLVFDFYK